MSSNDYGSITQEQLNNIVRDSAISVYEALKTMPSTVCDYKSIEDEIWEHEQIRVILRAPRVYDLLRSPGYVASNTPQRGKRKGKFTPVKGTLGVTALRQRIQLATGDVPFTIVLGTGMTINSGDTQPTPATLPLSTIRKSYGRGKPTTHSRAKKVTKAKVAPDTEA